MQPNNLLHARRKAQCHMRNLCDLYESANYRLHFRSFPSSILRSQVMYQSNWSLNIPTPGIPRAFDVFSCTGGREFDELSLPRERYPICGGLAEKQRLTQALLCILRYSRPICIIFGIQECCVLNHVYIHSFRSILEATEKFPGGWGIWSPGMDL